jgi:hypothetical protein
MLFHLADHELCLAEVAAERQRPYRSPDRWSLRHLTYSTFYNQIIAMQWTRHRVGLAAEKAARKAGWSVDAARAIAVCSVRQSDAPSTIPEDYVTPRPDDWDIKRFNPSRAILGLERRGFVVRDHYWRHANLALTVEGFGEARRLGGVRASEIVDLDRVAANWRAVRDFQLGVEFAFNGEDDGPPRGEDIGCSVS